ncbi:MAG: ketopantoate reductase family protein [Candidatus Thorarchaeota archaeon]
MNILVVGPGAIGTAAAASLAKNKYSVYLLGKERHKEHLQNKPLIYHTKNNTMEEKIIPIVLDDFTTNKLPKFDALLFTLKANQTLASFEQLDKYLPKDIPVFSLQNGLIAEEIYNKTRFKNVIACVISFNVKTDNTCEATQTSEGEIVIGKIGTNSTSKGSSKVPLELIEMLSSITKIVVSDNILNEVWLKVMINSTINPICAIGNIPLGELPKNNTSNYLALWIWRELMQVVKAEGMKLDPYMGQLYPELLYTYDIISYGIASSIINQLFAPHKDAIVSMLQDVRNKKETEIDYLNGRIFEIGQKHNISMPVNKLIIKTIKEIEKGEKTPSKGLLTKLYRSLILDQ